MKPRLGDDVYYRRQGELWAAKIQRVPNGQAIGLAHLTIFEDYGIIGYRSFVPQVDPDGRLDGWFPKPPNGCAA
jgi:hypothetical protein